MLDFVDRSSSGRSGAVAGFVKQNIGHSTVCIPVGNETWYATKCGGSKVQISVNLTININTDKTISHASPSQIAQKFSSKQDTTLATGSENFVAIGIWEMDLR